MSSQSQSTPQTYRNPALTVDALVVKPSSHEAGRWDLLLIQRDRDPFKGCWACPGGFVDYGEDPSIAVVRELEEETHLKMKAGARPQLVTVRGHPDRDPRQHIVTIAYFVPLDIESLPDMRGDDDAKEAAWFPLEDLRREKAIEFHCQPVRLAFDHQSIINEFYSCLTQGFPPLQ